MAKQLVLSGNRVIAHGEDCFLSMGGTVICPESGRVYQNATVAECDNYPSDIGEVGYEYHAGEFIPCAPFGKGGGNVAVLCPNDCKSIKDSGKSAEHLGDIEVIEYPGTGNNSCSITSNIEPLYAIIHKEDRKQQGKTFRYEYAIITPYYGVSFCQYSESAPVITWLDSGISGNTLSWTATSGTKGEYAANFGGTYRAIVFGRA